MLQIISSFTILIGLSLLFQVGVIYPPSQDALATTNDISQDQNIETHQISLSKLKVTDPDHRIMSLVEIKAEHPVSPFNVGVTFKNNFIQGAVDGPQSFTLVMEARDENGTSVAMGTLDQTLPNSDEEINATIEWEAAWSGRYEIRLMAISDFQNPEILSSVANREIIVVGNSHCDESLWDHVYNPTRLHIVHECLAVIGIASFISTNENDGDEHVGIRPDPENAHLVNEQNKKHHNGAILGEVICYSAPKKAAPAEACENYENSVTIPPRYSYVRMTGSYVLDTQHNLWGEIHPITSIVVIDNE